MTDLTFPSKPGVLPVLATATGEAGEMLRLTRMEDSDWSWDGKKECTLRLPAIDRAVEVDEVVWGDDGLPITQLKFAQSISQAGTIRWLLVQKQTVTMIFRPEFSKVPKTRTLSYQSTGPMLSRIDPKLVLTLNHRQTGGNAHVDMAFNPPVRDRPLQLCIIDECGYWTLWNLTSIGRMGKGVGLTLFRGGHIWEGPLAAIPPRPDFPAEVHGVLFVGTEDDDNIINLSSEDTSTKTKRSKRILLWNSENLRIVDVEANTMLPEIAGLTTTKKHHGRIINVQLSPVSQNHIYVLTARYLIWIELVVLTSETGSSIKPKIRLTCPHFLPGEPHLKLAINPYHSTGAEGTLVYVYSSNHDQISAHWFHLKSGSERPQWHSQLLTISTEQDDDSRAPSTFRDLLFLPLSIDLLPRAKGPGPFYLQEDVRFFQGWLLGHDLSVHYCMCFTSIKPQVEVILPHKRLNWTSKDKVKKAKHRRKAMLGFLGRAAVVPDVMTDEAILSLQYRYGELELEHGEDEARDSNTGKRSRPIQLNLRRFLGALEEEMDKGSEGEGVSDKLLEAVQGAIQHGFGTGRLPLSTWKEIADGLDPDDASDPMPPEDIEEAMQGFLSGAGDEAVITQLGRRDGKAPDREIGSLLLMENQLSSAYLQPQLSEIAAQRRTAWVSSLARELFLSTHGVAVQDVSLFGQSQMIKAEPSQSSFPSMSQVQSSQLGSSIPSSQTSTSSASAPDEAYQRISLLASDIQPIADLSKPAAVLDLWPSERGVTPVEYVSSVAVATDKRFDYARQKYEKLENKKKKMREKLKPAFKRKGFPGSEQDSLPIRPPILSSQAPPIIKSETQPKSSQGPMPNIMSSQGQMLESSQIQPRGGVTMSQVVPGVFGGDRKKAKKTKKKSGFR